ncbi:MAG: hypothetical protein ACT6Q8_10495 [Niveispirillum sp.]|uniref:hypothetical protein n=1 Tax=Niveispirillum sp. TaxID=1917217 RepID=UPI004035EBDE
MMTPELQEATGIHHYVPTSRALLLADRLEMSLMDRGWPVGHVLGSEIDLAREHGATPPAMRQALRVLEWRGLGQMRRGASGGLLIHTPSLAVTGRRLMALHLMARGVPVEAVRAARTTLLLRLPIGQIDLAPARAFVVELFGHIEGAWQDVQAAQPSNNRALRIAHRILRDGWGGGVELGTIDDLMETHSACRAIIIQSLRILENLGVAISVRGRTGGFKRIDPTPGSLVRSTLPHFVAHAMDIEVCNQLIGIVNEINAAQAAERERDPERLRMLAGRLQVEELRRGNVASHVALLRHVATSAGNEVLHMLVRCLWYYWHHKVMRNAAPPVILSTALAGEMIAVTQRIVAEILAGKPDDARFAMAECGEVARAIHGVVNREQGNC